MEEKPNRFPTQAALIAVLAAGWVALTLGAAFAG